VTDTVLCVVIGTLLFRLWRQHRHLLHLRRSVTTLVPGYLDAWPLHCEACGRQMRAAHTLVCTELREWPDGRPSRTVVRVWHADRPRCSAAFAADDLVMDTYLKGGRP
jgi:hypothetical protein